MSIIMFSGFVSAQTVVIPKDWTTTGPIIPDNVEEDIFSSNFGEKNKSYMVAAKPELIVYVHKLKDYIALDVNSKGELVNILASPQNIDVVENAILQLATTSRTDGGGLAGCYGDNAQEGGTFGDVSAAVLCIADAIIDHINAQ